MQHQSPRIADYLQHQSTNHPRRETPCFVADAEVELGGEEGREEGEVEGVSGDGRLVVDECVVEAAHGMGIGGGAEREQARGGGVVGRAEHFGGWMVSVSIKES